MFLHVSVCPWWGGAGGIQAHTQREVEGSGWGGVSRPPPRGGVEGSGLGGGGSPGPHPWGRFVSVSVSVSVSGSMDA